MHPWMVGALLTMIATGIPMFLSESLKCYYSPPFWYKMGSAGAGDPVRFYRAAASAGGDRPGAGRYRATAVVSLALWFGVGFSGRWIAFYWGVYEA